MIFYKLNIYIFFLFLLISECFAESLFEKHNPFIFIEGGKFIFGNNNGEENEKPQSEENIKNFYINKYEVSNKIFNKYVSLSGNRNSYFFDHFHLGKDTHPVVGVSWQDAKDFCIFIVQIYQLNNNMKEQQGDLMEIYIHGAIKSLVQIL